MVLQDKRKREYTPKYQYPENFRPYISNVDKFSFGLLDDDSYFHISNSSEESFEAAEEKVYKQFIKYSECKSHSFKPLFPNTDSSTARCEHCGVNKLYSVPLSSPCDVKECFNKPFFSDYSHSLDKTVVFCKEHFSKEIDKILKTNSKKLDKLSLEIESSKDFDIHQDLTMEYSHFIFYRILFTMDSFWLLSDEQQRKVMEKAQYQPSRIINNFILRSLSLENMSFGQLMAVKNRMNSKSIRQAYDDYFLHKKQFVNVEIKDYKKMENDNYSHMKKIYEFVLKRQ